MAGDNGDAALTRRAFTLMDAIEKRDLTPKQSVLLHYFRSNAWENRLRENAKKQSWDWDIEEIQNQILHLRLAARHEGFEELEEVWRCAILTNLANTLNSVGRVIEAIELWDRVLCIEKRFAMALANRGLGFSYYARSVYDQGHAYMLQLAAADSYAEASSPEAVFESVHNAAFSDQFKKAHEQIAAQLDLDSARENLNSTEFSLGDTPKECAYRKWVLRNRLFLNPLNDIGAKNIAAQDILTLPSMTFAFDEYEGPNPPPVIGFYNQLKQEFVSARYIFYEGAELGSGFDTTHFSDKDVALYNTLDYPSYALAVEKVRLAYRMAYSLFDKIAFFINHYMQVGWADDKVNFRNVWYRFKKDRTKELRPIFQGRENLALRGLFWLSKDIFEPEFKKVMEPEAESLAEIRNFLEHKYFQVHESWALAGGLQDHLEGSPGYHISRKEFEAKTLRVLKLARSALIYLSLAVYREEQMRHADKEGLVASMPLSKWDDEWKV